MEAGLVAVCGQAFPRLNGNENVKCDMDISRLMTRVSVLDCMIFWGNCGTQPEIKRDTRHV